MRKKSRQLNRDLLDAIVMRDKERIRHLIKLGANVEAIDKEHNEATIILAAKFCDAEIVELLINKGAKVDARDDQGRTALFFAEVGSNVFTSLVAAGADVHDKDSDGNWILMQKVSESPSVAEVEELLRLGIKPDVRNHDGESAMDLSVSLGLLNVIERLRG